MSSTYAGDPSAYPADFTIPDDSDPPTAAAFNIPIEALGDRTANLNARATDLDDRVEVIESNWSLVDLVSCEASGTLVGSITVASTDNTTPLLSASVPTLAGDVVVAEFSSYIRFNKTNNGAVTVWLYLNGNQNGAGSVALQPSYRYISGLPNSSGDFFVPVSTRAAVTITTPGTFALSVFHRLTTWVAADNALILPVVSASLRIYRKL